MEITVITGDQSLVHKVIEQYFNFIQLHIDTADMNLLQQNPNMYAHPHFERREYGLHPLYKERKNESLRASDVVFMLLYKDKVIATVTETYNDFNYAQFSFFDRLDEVLEEVRRRKKED